MLMDIGLNETTTRKDDAEGDDDDASDDGDAHADATRDLH